MSSLLVFSKPRLGWAKQTDIVRHLCGFVLSELGSVLQYIQCERTARWDDAGAGLQHDGGGRGWELGRRLLGRAPRLLARPEQRPRPPRPDHAQSGSQPLRPEGGRETHDGAAG